MVNKYAIVKDGVVINVALWDGESEWSPSEGKAILCPDDISPGWLYEKDTFVDPNAPAAPTDDELYDKELADINADYEQEKNLLASAFLNAALFEGENEQQKKTDIRLKLKELNQRYDNSMKDLDKKYGG